MAGKRKASAVLYSAPMKVMRGGNRKRVARRTIPSTVSTTKLAQLNVIGRTPFNRGREINHEYRTLYGNGPLAKLVQSEPTSAQKVLINQIAVGSGSMNRVGRMIDLRSLVFRWYAQAPKNGAGGLIRMVVVFDKRPERSQELQFTDLFITDQGGQKGAAMMCALPKEAHDGRYEYLLDKTVRVNGSAPQNFDEDTFEANDTEGFASVNNAVTGLEIIDLTAKRFYTQYIPSGTSGVESDIEYGTLHFFCWSNVSSSSDISFDEAQYPRLKAYCELRWQD